MTTDALTPKSEIFDGIPVRVVEIDNQEMIPVVDIARSLQMDRSNLSRLLKNHKRFFLGKIREVKLTTPRGIQTLICITGFAAIGLLYKIDAGRSKNPHIEEKIVAFQSWATNLIEKKMQVQSKIIKDYGVSKNEWSQAAIEHLNFAKSIADSNPGIDAGMCLAIGIRQAEKATGIDLTAYKKLIPPTTQEGSEQYITATQIGKIIGNRSAIEVNRYLERMGYIGRTEDNQYFLTEKGSEYGKLFPGAFSSGHIGYFIKWKRSIIADSLMAKNNPCRIRE